TVFSEPPASFFIAQAPSETAQPGSTQNEPPAGEIQERAVVPGMAPGPGDVTQPTRPPITRPPSPGIAPQPGVTAPALSPQRDPSRKLPENLQHCGPTDNRSKV